MNQERHRAGQSRKLIWLLLAVTVPPAATLVWLGIQLLQQDRSLAAQREVERQAAAAQAIVHHLERSLATAESWLQGQPPPSGALRLTFSGGGVTAYPADRVLWVHSPPRLADADDRQFAEAERLEFQAAAGAVALYERAARSPVRPVRAGALVRLARVQRRQREWDAALATYRELTAITDVAVAGAPADFQARRAACAVLEESGRVADLARAAAGLEADLLSGRWLLDHAAWTLTASELQRWTKHAVAETGERRLFSSVIDALAGDHAVVLSRSPLQTRRVIAVGGAAVTVISRVDDRQSVAVAIAPSLVSAWVGQATAEGLRKSARVSVLDPSGGIIHGAVAATATGAVRIPASETTLPWTVVVSADGDSSLADELAGRRRLLMAGLGAMLLLLGGGAYFLWRVLHRELAVARLQTDFVAAVSHEFRTPLTSLRHVAELLEESDDLPAERRLTFYRTLGRNTERLHRLVESLLDFSRMEGGRKPYDFRPLDAADLMSQIVADFARDGSTHGYTVNLHAEAGDHWIRADPQALTHALWNLLDNAVKYSPNHDPIDVSIHSSAGGVGISVRDRGLGVAVPRAPAHLPAVCPRRTGQPAWHQGNRSRARHGLPHRDGPRRRHRARVRRRRRQHVHHRSAARSRGADAR